MQVTETLEFPEYWQDPRFARKRPMRRGSRKQSCGDNIYFKNADGNWGQLDSFHTNADGSLKPEHVKRDTGEGPVIPAQFCDPNHYDICRKVRQRKRLEDHEWIAEFAGWLSSFGDPGFYGKPVDWIIEDA